MIDPNEFQLYAPFTKIQKQRDGTIRVHAVIHDETVDDQNEIIDYDGGKAAIDDFMKWSNVREMHGDLAIGTVESVSHDDALRKSEGVLHIVDPIAVLKIETGVLKGTSWGGMKGTEKALEKIGGQTATRLLKPTFIELSAVDRPSRPTAVMTLMKRTLTPTTGSALADAIALSATRLQAAGIPPRDEGDDPMAKNADTPAGKPVPAATQIVVPRPAQPPQVATPVQEPAQGKGPNNAGSQQPVPDLKKAASDDLAQSHMIEEMLAKLIEVESGDQPSSPGQIAKLQEAMAALMAFDQLEATELGTPADTEEVAADAAEEEEDEDEMVSGGGASTIVIAAAAKTGDLRKVGARNAAQDQAVLDQICALCIQLGANPPAPAQEAAPAPAPVAPAAAPAPIAKAANGPTPEQLTDQMIDRFYANAPFAKAAEVEAMKAEILGVLTPLKEDLAKVAGQPMPGGPFRYAPDPFAKGNDPHAVNNGIAEAFAKAAENTSDPILRERLSRESAAAEIAEIHSQGSRR